MHAAILAATPAAILAADRNPEVVSQDCARGFADCLAAAEKKAADATRDVTADVTLVATLDVMLVVEVDAMLVAVATNSRLTF
jgi:hypothetical protein